MGKNRRKDTVAAKFAEFLGRGINPFSEISDLGALRRYNSELSQALTSLNRERERIRTLQQMVSEAMHDLEGKLVDAIPVRITDHAVVRYLERHNDIDMSEVELEILAMFEAGRPEIACRDGVIATVLPPGESSIEHLAMKEDDD